jgi:hypothetical protein
MPTGSYDAVVLTTLFNATQPFNIYVDNYLAFSSSASPSPASVGTLSPVIVGVPNYPIIIIDSKNTTAPNVFIIG